MRADPRESYASEHHSRFDTHYFSAGCASASRYMGGGGVEWSHRGEHRIRDGTVLAHILERKRLGEVEIWPV